MLNFTHSVQAISIALMIPGVACAAEMWSSESGRTQMTNPNAACALTLPARISYQTQLGNSEVRGEFTVASVQNCGVAERNRLLLQGTFHQAHADGQECVGEMEVQMPCPDSMILRWEFREASAEGRCEFIGTTVDSPVLWRP